MSQLFACPSCGCRTTRVADSRETATHNQVVRLRVCRSCGHRMRTRERIVRPSEQFGGGKMRVASCPTCGRYYNRGRKYPIPDLKEV